MSCLTQRESKANLFFCSCLSNAPSSEAVLLFKPLKELRAKRKGTHLVGLHACAFLETFVSVWFVWEQISLKRWNGWNYSSLPRVQLLLLFLCESVRSELLFHWTGQLEPMTFSQTDILCWFWQTRWDLVSRIFLCYFKGKDSRWHPPLLDIIEFLSFLKIPLLALCSTGHTVGYCSLGSHNLIEDIWIQTVTSDHNKQSFA